MARVLYLRFVMGGLNALFVVTVAVITLALALTISFRTLRTNAETSVSRPGQATAVSTDEFFAAPQSDMASLSQAPSTFGPTCSMLPADHPTFTTTPPSAGAFPGGELIAQYRRVTLSMMQRGDFRYTSIVIGFLDGTFSLNLLLVTPVARAFLHSVLLPSGPNAGDQTPRYVSAHTTDTGNFSDLLTAAVRPVLSQAPPSDMRDPSNRAILDAPLAASVLSPGTTVGWHDSYFVSFQGEDYFVIFLYALIKNSTHRLGVAQLGLRTADISAILTAGKLTAASSVFVYDKGMHLFGASEGLSVFATTNYTIGHTVPPGCASTEQSRQYIASDKVSMACRHHLSRVPLLGDAFRAAPSVFTAAAGTAQLVGKQYVFAARLRTVTGSRALSIALVVPEADMIGDADSILPLSAGITAGVVVFVAAVSFVLVWAVLRPLRGVAEQMGKAARLETDDGPVAISTLVEIGDLQRAFVEMRDELSRIRAFVPQSLLRRSSDDDDEDFDDAVSHAPPPQHPTVHDEPSMRSFSERPDDSLSIISSPGSTTETTRSRVVSGGKSVVAPHRAGLRTDAAVRREKVSVLSLNFVGFHASAMKCGGLSAVGKTVQIVLSTAAAEKGVVESFHGDRFLISFNAVKPAANHAIRASVVAARLAKQFSGGQGTALEHSGSIEKGVVKTKYSASIDSFDANPFSGLALTAGVASGVAYVGNVGCNEMRRFTIVGPVVTQAAVLERVCKLYANARVLVPQKVHDDIRTAVATRVVDCVRLPGMATPCLIAEASRELSAHAVDDEWMYQLAAAAAAQGDRPKTAIGHGNDNGGGNRGESQDCNRIAEEDAAAAATEAWALSMRMFLTSPKGSKEPKDPKAVNDDRAMSDSPASGTFPTEMGRVFETQGPEHNSSASCDERSPAIAASVAGAELELRRCIGVISAFEAQDRTVAQEALHGYAPTHEGPLSRLKSFGRLAASGRALSDAARDLGPFYTCSVAAQPGH